MAINISTLSVKLTAQTAAFSSSMANAAKPLASFGSSVLKVGGMVTGFGASLAGLAAGGSLIALTKGSFDSIDALKDQADALGVSTDALSRLNYAASFAGVGAEAMGGSLGKMLRNINEARNGSGAASDAFRMLGLDAGKLADLPADEAFREIAGAMQSVENPAQRVGLAMDVFGKSGAALIPVLTNGKEGLAEMAAEADRFGVTIKATDAAKIEAANDSMDRMKASIQGAANTLAIQLAPFIEVATSKLTDFITSGETGLTGKVVSGFESVVKGIAYASDYLSLLKAGFKLLQAGATLGVFGIVKAIDLLGKKFVDIANLLPGVNLEWSTFTGDLAEGLLEEADQLAAEAGKAFDSFANGDNSDKVGRFFDDIRTKSDQAAKAAVENTPKIGGAMEDLEDKAADLKKVSDSLADLHQQIEQFGMTDAQKKVADLKALGASPEQIAEAEASLNKLTDLDAQKKAQEDMQSRAKSVFDETRTPLEKYETKVGELSNLLNDGAINWDTYGRAIRQARVELEQSSKTDLPETPDVNSPDLMQAGSAQAARFAYDLSRGQTKMAKDDVPKQQLAEAAEATRLLDRLVRNTEPRGTDAATVVNI